MCCRYTLSDLKAIAALVEAADLGVDVDLDGAAPRHNVALTQRVPVITKRAKSKLEAMSFGLLLPARPPAKRPMLLPNAPRRDPHGQAVLSRRGTTPPLPSPGEWFLRVGTTGHHPPASLFHASRQPGLLLRRTLGTRDRDHPRGLRHRHHGAECPARRHPRPDARHSRAQQRPGVVGRRTPVPRPAGPALPPFRRRKDDRPPRRPEG